MYGYIKLYRKLMDSSIWTDSDYLKLWLYCLMKATHKKQKIIVGNSEVMLTPGQFITGRKSLAEDLNRGVKPKQRLSEKTWYRYLENLKKWDILAIEKTNQYSIISVNKWSEYQESDHQMSIESPSDDQQMSTNKNVKNVNNKYSSSGGGPLYNSDFLEIINFYQANLQVGQGSPHNEALIHECYLKYGKDLLFASMKIAAEHEKKGIKYVQGILKKWDEAGIEDIDDVHAYENEFRNKIKNNVVSLNRIKTDRNIDWGGLDVSEEE